MEAVELAGAREVEAVAVADEEVAGEDAVAGGVAAGDGRRAPGDGAAGLAAIGGAGEGTLVGHGEPPLGMDGPGERVDWHLFGPRRRGE